MFGGATFLAVASSTQAVAGHPARGVAAALAAGALWGTMYIPYRKAYLTGMNPLAFITFFTVGEVVMMLALALADRGGLAALAAELAGARDVLFWLLLGGFVWGVGDLFQQYAAKYVGISRSEEHTSELQSRLHLVCRLLLEKKKKKQIITIAVTI